MKYAILLAAAIAMPVQADWVFRQGDDIIRLTDAPCMNEMVLATYPPSYRPHFFQATSILNGKIRAPCWAAYDETTVIVVTEDGKGVKIDVAAFKVDLGI